MNDAERVYARKLLEMINSVDAGGSKVMDELRNDAFKEIVNNEKIYYYSGFQPYAQTEPRKAGLCLTFKRRLKDYNDI